MKVFALIKSLKFNAFHGTLGGEIICHGRSVKPQPLTKNYKSKIKKNDSEEGVRKKKKKRKGRNPLNLAL